MEPKVFRTHEEFGVYGLRVLGFRCFDLGYSAKIGDPNIAP